MKRAGHENQKRILFISYHFPPDNSVGGLRQVKFIKYLTQLGWTPSVLTIQDRYRESSDTTLLSELKQVSIEKTSKLVGVQELYMRSKRFGLARLKNGFLTTPEINDGGRSLNPAPPPVQDGLLQKLKRYVIALFINTPDENWTWVIPAAIRAVRLIKREKITCIVTSTPPHSSHLIGLLVKRLRRVHWVADFRDPWVDHLRYSSPLVRCQWSDRIQGWMESLIVRASDRVIVTTKPLKLAFEKRYQDQNQDPDKFVYIPNGIDWDLLSKEPNEEKFDTFTITYAGTLYFGRTPEPVFQAVKDLITSRQISASDLRIQLIGNCETVNGIPTGDLIRHYGLDGMAEISPWLPFSKAWQIIRRSHLLLLIAPENHELIVPEKTYEYLASGTRILGITEKGATSEVIEETGGGACFSPLDIPGIRDYILQSWKNRSCQQTPARQDKIRQFDMRILAQRLDKELSSLIDHSL